MPLKLGVSEQTYHCWRKEYGGLRLGAAGLPSAQLGAVDAPASRLADGSCVRQRPEYRHHVGAYDFVADRTQDGRPLKILTVVEEYSRECLAIVVARGLRSFDVLETLAVLFVTHGVPAHQRLW